MMKNLHNSALMLCLIAMFLISCNGDGPPINPNSADDFPNVVLDDITNTEFDDWTKYWVSNGQTYFNALKGSDGILEYFDVPIVDLHQVIKESRKLNPIPDDARFYFGLDSTTTPEQLHLIVVGIDTAGTPQLDNSKGQYAYDLSKPCPTHCHPPK